MQWRLDVHALGNIQENTVLRKSPGQRGKLAFFDVDHLPDQPGNQVGVFFQGSLQVSKNDALLGEFVVQVNLRAARQQNDLSAMLVRDQRLKQVFRDGRQVL